jgi:hypothetical protein
MAKLNIKQIRDVAKEQLKNHPDGVRFKQLVNLVFGLHPESNYNTVFTVISTLHHSLPGDVVKPTRGLFQLAANADVGAPTNDGTSRPDENMKPAKVGEEDFYQSFADWLRTDLDEVTVAAAMGGAGLKVKWGTPDVIGIYKPQAVNLIKFPIEIVAAEVKIDPQQPVVAFGQAAAYRLFSHKTYIAMPTTLTVGDQGRLESLCMLFGVGLVLFDLNVKSPNYAIRVRAQRCSPDMFYVNDFADRLKSHNTQVFEQLFG